MTLLVLTAGLAASGGVGHTVEFQPPPFESRVSELPGQVKVTTISVPDQAWIDFRWLLHDAGYVDDRRERAAAQVAFAILEERIEFYLRRFRVAHREDISWGNASSQFQGTGEAMSQLWIRGSEKAISSTVQALITEDITGTEFVEAVENTIALFLGDPSVMTSTGRLFGTRITPWSEGGSIDTDVFDVAEVTLEDVQAAYHRWLWPPGGIVRLSGPLPLDELEAVAAKAIEPWAGRELAIPSTRSRDGWNPRVRARLGVDLDQRPEQLEEGGVAEIVTVPAEDVDAALATALIDLSTHSRLQAQAAGPDLDSLEALIAQVLFHPSSCEALLVIVRLHTSAPTGTLFDDRRQALVESFDEAIEAGVDYSDDASHVSMATIEFPTRWWDRCLELDTNPRLAYMGESHRPSDHRELLEERLQWDEANGLVFEITGPGRTLVPRYDEAFDAIHQLSPDPERFRAAALAMQALMPGKDDSGEAARKLAIEAPHLALARLTLAKHLVRAERPREALAEFDAALAINPQQPDALARAFEVALLDLEDPELAIRYADRFVALAPELPRARSQRSRALLALDRKEEAHEELIKLAETQPENADAWVALARFRYEELDLPVDAARSYLKAHGIEETYHDVFLQPMTEILAETYDAGLTEAVEGILALLRDDAELLRRVGVILCDNLKAFEAALLLFEEFTILEPESPRAWSLVGHSKALLGRNDEAREALEHATSLNEGYGWAWCRLGDLLRDAYDDKEGALTAFRSCIDNFGAYRAPLDAAHLLDKLGRHSEAWPLYESYIEDVPSDAEARTEYASSLCTDPERLGDARRAFANALDLVEEAAPVIAARAKCLARQGLDQPALEDFRRAVELKPEDASSWRAMGDVLDRLERGDEAAAARERANSLDASEEEVVRGFVSAAEAHP